MLLKITTGALAAAAIAGSAFAADLPSRKAVVVAPPPVFTWTGFYIGIDRGWGWNNNTAAYTPAGAATLLETLPLSAGIGASGASLGGHIGYNWQFGSLVLGAEADIAAASISGTTRAAAPSLITPAGVNGMMVTRKIDALASLRARLGYAFESPLGPTMLYVTGGAAWEQFSTAAMTSSNAAPGIFGQTASIGASHSRFGYNVGVGGEWAFAPNWSARLEYLYYGFGGATSDASAFANCFIAGGCGYAQSSGRDSIHMIRSGLNYRFGGPGGFTAPWSSGPVASWTGFYFGGNAGWGWSSPAATMTPASFVAPISSGTDLPVVALGNGLHGGLTGLQAGFNWQFSSVVLGVEADIDAASINSTRQSVFPSLLVPALGLNGFYAHQRIDWLASARARAGFAFGPALLYVTGGVGFESVKTRAMVNSNTAVAVFGTAGFGDFNTTRVGYVVGGGLEWMIAQNWSLRAEYLHYGFDQTSTGILATGVAPPNCAVAGACNVAVGTGKNSVDVVRTAVNYRFNWGAAAPVVAKY